MNTASIERRETGPADQDRTASAWFGNDTTERELYDGFMKSVDNGDANALCSWAPKTTDWDAAGRLPIDQRTTVSLPKRAQTMAECMAESLDHGDGPSMTEAMQLILNVATGCDESTRSQAMRLLERMGDSFAKHNC